MNSKTEENLDKALDEKRGMQKVFTEEKGHPCPVLKLVIEHLEGMGHE